MRERLGGRRHDRRRGQLGQSVVEAALLAPIFLLLAGVGGDFGRLFAAQMTVSDAARQGARYLAATPSDAGVASSCGGFYGGTVKTVLQEAAGSPFPVQCSEVSASINGPDAYSSYVASVTISLPFSFITPVISQATSIRTATASATARSASSGGGPAPGPSPTPSPCPYSGQAYAAATSGLHAAGVAVPDSQVAAVTLPCDGTPQDMGLGTYTLPGVITAAVQDDHVAGLASVANASAQGVTVSVLPHGDPATGADLADVSVANASAQAGCAHGAFSESASSSIGSVSIDGTPVVPPRGGGSETVGDVATLTWGVQSSTSTTITQWALVIDFSSTGHLSSVISGRVIVMGAYAGFGGSC